MGDQAMPQQQGGQAPDLQQMLLQISQQLDNLQSSVQGQDARILRMEARQLAPDAGRPAIEPDLTSHQGWTYYTRWPTWAKDPATAAVLLMAP